MSVKSLLGRVLGVTSLQNRAPSNEKQPSNDPFSGSMWSVVRLMSLPRQKWS